jgi:predicted nucleic acid-binding protein
MMVFLDANPVIYYVEQPPIWGSKAKAHVTAVIAAGEQLAVTDLVRMECLVGPFKKRDGKVETDFRIFFKSPDMQVLPITAAVCERAARIRATHGFKPLDSLHLAAAVEFGCTRFITNDGRLSSFPDIPIEVLS